MTRHGAGALPFDGPSILSLPESLRRFQWRGAPTRVDRLAIAGRDDRTTDVERFTNEFWTAKQRAAHSLHEISYRACFKPQLPAFFIDRLTQPGDVVYDPFMGRGTTLVQTALMGRTAYGCDVNPLSRVLCEPRLAPPSIAKVEQALAEVDPEVSDPASGDLLVFYHPDTLRHICALRRHLLRKEASGTLTRGDRWVRMVATNRLTGHSPGFFSVYTLPPNQAVSAQSQARINARLNQTPPYRDVRSIILEKSRSLLRDCTDGVCTRLDEMFPRHRFVLGQAAHTEQLQDESISLVVTSPPFLDVVDYKTDNWLRCWFCGIDAASVPVTQASNIEGWTRFVTDVLVELRRVLRIGGHIAFEVGEVRGGSVRLEEAVVPAGVAAGLDPLLVLVNAQHFTKTANCWGVSNNRKGTNSNRVVVFRRAR
jgi:hypothetical protein